MPEEERVYTSGMWMVKQDKLSEFVSTWHEFAESARGRSGAIEAILLQDNDVPQYFTSFGQWDSLAGIKKWRSEPSFKDYMARLGDLCDNVQILTMKPVAHVSIAAPAGVRT